LSPFLAFLISPIRWSFESKGNSWKTLWKLTLFPPLINFERILAEWSIILVHFLSQLEVALIVLLSKSGPIKPKGKSIRFFSILFLSSIFLRLRRLKLWSLLIKLKSFTSLICWSPLMHARIGTSNSFSNCARKITT